MERKMIVCDKCGKDFEDKTSVYATIFINARGCIDDRFDVCLDCWHEMFANQAEKGGAEE